MDNGYVGECLDIGLMIGSMYQYDDLQEPYIEFDGSRISKVQANVILDKAIIEEAKRLLSKRTAEHPA